MVVGAHDVIHNPESVVRFCEAAGLDTDAIRFDWSDEDGGKESETAKRSNGLMDSDMHQKASRIMLSTLEPSKGIVKNKAPATVDIKAEAEKWRKEFGSEVAGLIEKAVWDAMPDYEYLKERRVR